MKKNLLLFFIFTILTCFISCSNEDEGVVEQPRNVLSELFVKVVESRSPTEGPLYAICNTYDQGEMSLAIFICDDLSDSDFSNISTRSSGWNYGGYASGRIQAVILGGKLAQKFEKDKTVLIKIVPDKEKGGWHVYWRYE